MLIRLIVSSSSLINEKVISFCSQGIIHFFNAGYFPSLSGAAPLTYMGATIPSIAAGNPNPPAVVAATGDPATSQTNLGKFLELIPPYGKSSADYLLFIIVNLKLYLLNFLFLNYAIKSKLLCQHVHYFKHIS